MEASGQSESTIPAKNLFRIGEVSRLTSTKPFVLRFWETEFPMLQPVKSPKGHRLYRRQDIETVFDGLPVKEYAVFAANCIWPKKELGHESLVLLLRLEQNQTFDNKLLEDISVRNRRLPDFKRVGGYLVWDKDFPRTASMKIKRQVLAEEIAKSVERKAVVKL